MHMQLNDRWTASKKEALPAAGVFIVFDSLQAKLGAEQGRLGGLGAGGHVCGLSIRGTGLFIFRRHPDTRVSLEQQVPLCNTSIPNTFFTGWNSHTTSHISHTHII